MQWKYLPAKEQENTFCTDKRDVVCKWHVPEDLHMALYNKMFYWKSLLKPKIYQIKFGTKPVT